MGKIEFQNRVLIYPSCTSTKEIIWSESRGYADLTR